MSMCFLFFFVFFFHFRFKLPAVTSCAFCPEGKSCVRRQHFYTVCKQSFAHIKQEVLGLVVCPPKRHRMGRCCNEAVFGTEDRVSCKTGCSYQTNSLLTGSSLLQLHFQFFIESCGQTEDALWAEATVGQQLQRELQRHLLTVCKRRRRENESSHRVGGRGRHWGGQNTSVWGRWPGQRTGPTLWNRQQWLQLLHVRETVEQLDILKTGCCPCRKVVKWTTLLVSWQYVCF